MERGLAITNARITFDPGGILGLLNPDSRKLISPASFQLVEESLEPQSLATGTILQKQSDAIA
jgi:hypothetical protein